MAERESLRSKIRNLSGLEKTGLALAGTAGALTATVTGIAVLRDDPDQPAVTRPQEDGGLDIAVSSIVDKHIALRDVEKILKDNSGNQLDSMNFDSEEFSYGKLIYFKAEGDGYRLSVPIDSREHLPDVISNNLANIAFENALGNTLWKKQKLQVIADADKKIELWLGDNEGRLDKDQLTSLRTLLILEDLHKTFEAKFKELAANPDSAEYGEFMKYLSQKMESFSEGLPRGALGGGSIKNVTSESTEHEKFDPVKLTLPGQDPIYMGYEDGGFLRKRVTHVHFPVGIRSEEGEVMGQTYGLGDHHSREHGLYSMLNGDVSELLKSAIELHMKQQLVDKTR